MKILAKRVSKISLRMEKKGCYYENLTKDVSSVYIIGNVLIVLKLAITVTNTLNYLI